MNKSRLSFTALFAIAATVAVLRLTSGPPINNEVKWENATAEAQKGGYRLISTEDLYERYNQNGNNLLIVDTRQEWEYRTGHIKGAINFPITPNWFSRWQKKGALGEFLGRDKARDIVFY